jgi:hypothetical protein
VINQWQSHLMFDHNLSSLSQRNTIILLITKVIKTKILKQQRTEFSFLDKLVRSNQIVDICNAHAYTRKKDKLI